MMSFFVLALFVGMSDGLLLHRNRRGAYMTPYSRPHYEDNHWGQPQNNYNPYQSWNNNNQWNNNNGYQNSYGSSYGRPSNYAQSSYGAPRSSYGRPEPSYSPYSRPTSSYGRPPQFNTPSPVMPPVESPVVPPPVIPSVDTPVVTQPIVPPTPEVPVVPPVAPVAPPVAPPVPPTPSPGPLFGGVDPGAGALSPGVEPPPTDEEMTRVDAAEKENEVRKARGGPPGINVDAIAETGTLPPQAAIPDIPMPPSK